MSTDPGVHHLKVILDVTAATKFSGGMRLHAAQIIEKWQHDAPQDAIWIVCPRTFDLEPGVGPFHVIPVPSENFIVRLIWSQVFVAALYLIVRPQILLSLGPSVSLLVPGRHRASFFHDWRHLRRPAEFSRLQRLGRRIWARAAATNAIDFCVSRKTLRETEAMFPTAHSILVQNGYDEALSWGFDNASLRQERMIDSSHIIITFAHHSNKRPELMVSAMPAIVSRDSLATLTVLGARGAQREQLAAQVRSLGIQEHVDLVGFVPVEDYRRKIAKASIVCLISSDEGYGLPVSEALALGIPVLVASDGGLSDIYGTLVRAVAPNAVDIASACLDLLKPGVRSGPGNLPTWSQAVGKLRAELVLLVSRK